MCEVTDIINFNFCQLVQNPLNAIPTLYQGRHGPPKNDNCSLENNTWSSRLLGPLCFRSFGLSFVVIRTHELVVLVKTIELPCRSVPIPIPFHDLFFLFLPLPSELRLRVGRRSSSLRTTTLLPLLPLLRSLAILHNLILHLLISRRTT